METLTDNATGCPTKNFPFCQTLGLVLRLRVDFVLPLSQQEQQQEQQEEPPTKYLSCY